VVVNGAVVNVSYDLVAPDAESTFVVVLEASQNDGKSYDLKLTAVTGDVGSGIRPGPGKRIVWEAAKDTDSLQLAQFRYRVALKPLTSPPASAAAGSAAKPAAQPLAQSQKPVTPALPQQPRAAGGGNSMKWPGLGLIGGGGALSAMAAAGPLRKDPYDCDCELMLNKPLVGAGIAVAAAGVLLMVLGGGGGAQSISVTALPKGLSVGKTIRFDWPRSIKHD
jgi:hypothetical protein